MATRKAKSVDPDVVDDVESDQVDELVEPVTGAALTEALNTLAMAMVGSPTGVTGADIADLVARATGNAPDAGAE